MSKIPFSNRISAEAAEAFEKLYEAAIEQKGTTRENFPKGRFLEELFLSEKPTINSDELTAVQHENFRLHTENQLLKDKIQELQQRAPETVEVDKPLADNQFIVTAAPFLMQLLQHVCNIKSKETGKETTPESLLLQLFWDDLQNPRSNNLGVTITGNELRRMHAIYKSNNSQNHV